MAPEDRSRNAAGSTALKRRDAQPIVPARAAAGAALAFCAVSGFFVARFPIHDSLASVSTAFVLLFFAPSAAAAAHWLGGRRGGLLLCGLGLYALLLETAAVRTGVPYGHFAYGAKIGARLFGTTPWTVPFSWTPLALLALTVAARLARGPAPAVAGAVLVALDLTLDPGAVAQGLWRYENPGVYYGVPWTNFAGWALTGTIGAEIARRLSGGAPWSAAPPALALSGLLSLVFWTSVCTFSGLWVPALLGTALAAGALWALR